MKCAVKHREREDIRSEAIKQAVHYMLVTFIQFLGDKRGWKPESICNAMRYCVSHAESIVGGWTTLEEAEEDIADRYGIRFTDDGGIYYDGKGGKGQ